MTMRWVVKTAAVLLVGLSALPALAGFHGYISIKGSKQGEFKGEKSRPGHPEEIRFESLKLEAATGMNGRKWQHKSVVITKERGASSPQLEQAAEVNEVLPEVKIVFETPNGAGRSPRAVETVQLKNAVIVRRRLVGQMEEITLNYQDIVVTYANGSKSATDDWEAPND